jgi:hypothetical protein
MARLRGRRGWIQVAVTLPGRDGLTQTGRPCTRSSLGGQPLTLAPITIIQPQACHEKARPAAPGGELRWVVTGWYRCLECGGREGAGGSASWKRLSTLIVSASLLLFNFAIFGLRLAGGRSLWKNGASWVVLPVAPKRRQAAACTGSTFGSLSTVPIAIYLLLPWSMVW